MSTQLITKGDFPQSLELVHTPEPLSIGENRVHEVLEVRKRILDMMRTGMKEGLDYGPPFPGSDKPSLLQPGADKICSMLQVRPEFKIENEILEKDFIYYRVSCELIFIPTGVSLGHAIAVCNSREEKYGWRKAKRKCPECGKETVIRGKKEYGGGWLCWSKAGKSDGCGQKFPDGAKEIEDQVEGKVPAENIWEQSNTMLQMAQKRSKVSATKTLATVSDIFTLPEAELNSMPEFAGYESEAEPEIAHREGNNHLSTLCQQCVDAGVPEGMVSVLNKGCIYLRKQEGKVPLTHDFEHKCHFYCPRCRAVFLDPRKTTEAERAKLPPLPIVEKVSAVSSPQPEKTAEATTVSAASSSEGGSTTTLAAADSGSGAASSSPPPSTEVISMAQRNRMFAIAKEAGWQKNELKEFLVRGGIESSKDIPKSRYEQLVNCIIAGRKIAEV